MTKGEGISTICRVHHSRAFSNAENLQFRVNSLHSKTPSNDESLFQDGLSLFKDAFEWPEPAMHVCMSNQSNTARTTKKNAAAIFSILVRGRGISRKRLGQAKQIATVIFLSVHRRMYACMHVCMYVSIYVCMSVCDICIQSWLLKLKKS